MDPRDALDLINELERLRNIENAAQALNQRLNSTGWIPYTSPEADMLRNALAQENT